MIQGIQDRTRTAIASMKSGTGTVEQGVITTNQAGEALERIIGMAERVDRMIAQIAIAASQQAAAADQSSASLDAIHSLSHDNLTEMATTTTGIESLRSTAMTLEQQVESFTLNPRPTSVCVPPPQPYQRHQRYANLHRCAAKRRGSSSCGPSSVTSCISFPREDLEVNLDVQLHQYRLSILHRRPEPVLLHRVHGLLIQPHPHAANTRTWLGLPLVSDPQVHQHVPRNFAFRASSENSGSTE